MGSKDLGNRDNWQTDSGKKAVIAEKNFHDVFSHLFKDSDYQIRRNPKEFHHIYEKVKIPKRPNDKFFNQKVTWTHGINIDYAIDNIKTKKTLYVEVKRQNGWVEGKKRKVGRGNVHERSCKYFTPGLLKILREEGKLGPDVLPFWVVFIGDTTRDPARAREITCWYEGISEHFFLWSDQKDRKSLINDFNSKLKSLLE